MAIIIREIADYFSDTPIWWQSMLTKIIKNYSQSTWNNMSDERRTHLINKMLVSYNAELIWISSSDITAIVFNTDQDFTFFLLMFSSVESTENLVLF